MRTVVRLRKRHLVLVAIALLATAASALAYLSSTGAAVAGAGVGALSKAVFSVPGTSGSSVTLTWSAQASTGSATADPGVRYTVERKLGSGSYAPVASGGCSGALPRGTDSCVDTLDADGTYSYRVVARFASWTSTSDAASTAATVAVTGSKLVFTSSPQTTAAGTSSGTITVQRRNAADTPATAGTTTVDLSTSSPAGAFRDTGDSAVITSVTIPAGSSSASLRYRDTKAGTPTITAADHAGALTLATQDQTVTPAAASRLAFTAQPAGARSGATLGTVKVAVQDTYGNTVSSSGTSVTAGLGNAGAATLSGTRTQATTSGSATFADLSVDKVGTGYTLTASAAGLAGATSSTFDITPGTPVKVAFQQQPTTTTSTQSITPPPTVALLDANGNVATDAAATAITIAIGANPAAGTLAGTKTVSTSNGVASFGGLSIDKAGTSYTLAASASGLTGATSSAFNVSAGPATTFQLNLPASTSVLTAGTSLSGFTLTALDASGNVATGYAGAHTLAWTAPSSPNNTAPTLPPSSLSFSSGVSGSFAAAMTRAGSVTLGVSETSGPSGSRTLTVDSAGVKLAFACPSGTVTRNTTFNVALSAPNDAYGNPFTRTAATAPTYSLALSGSNYSFVSPTSFPATMTASPTTVTIMESGNSKTTNLSMTSVSAPFTAASACTNITSN